MDMTPGEIIANYRQAKHKAKQVKILADLNVCSTDEIIKIIVENSNGEYKIGYFNKLKHKLKKDATSVDNKKSEITTKEDATRVEYKKPEIITKEEAISLKESDLDKAIKEVRKAIEMIDLQIAELKAERARILAECMGGVPF